MWANVLAMMYQADWATGVFDRNSPRVATLTTANYQMGVLDFDGYFTIGAAGVNPILEPCDGLPPGTRVATFKNATGAAVTVNAGIEYFGTIEDLIDGATTYSLAAGDTKNFVVTFPTGGDPAGGPCGVTATNASGNI